MDDLMNKLQEVLSDEESMEQIKKLASMLGADENSSPPDFSSFFGSLGGDNIKSNEKPQQNPQQKSGGSDFDLSKLLVLKDIMAKANEHDQSSDFLIALRPLLKPESQEKVDKLLKIFKILNIWPLLKQSGLLGGDLFGLL